MPKPVTTRIINYTFNTSDLEGDIPKKGDLYEFEVTGTPGSKANHPPIPLKLKHVSHALKGGGSIGATAAGDTATGQSLSIKLDRLLVKDTLDGAITTNFTINSMKKLEHAEMSNMTSKVNVYSFALKPEEHQPSGTCNFSRIDNAKLEIGTSTGMTASNNIYAVNYNVLRIMSGMGGLAYSN